MRNGDVVKCCCLDMWVCVCIKCIYSHILYWHSSVDMFEYRNFFYPNYWIKKYQMLCIVKLRLKVVSKRYSDSAISSCHLFQLFFKMSVLCSWIVEVSFIWILRCGSIIMVVRIIIIVVQRSALNGFHALVWSTLISPFRKHTE